MGKTAFVYSQEASNGVIRAINFAKPCDDVTLHVSQSIVEVTAHGRRAIKTQYDMLCDTIADKELKFVLKADQLVKLMMHYPTGKFTIDGKKINVSDGSRNISMTMPGDKEVEDFPEFPKTIKMHEFPKEAFDIAANLSFCCTKTEQQTQTMSSFVSIQNIKSRVTIASFDGYKFGVAEMKTDVQGCEEELFFPPELLKNLAGSCKKVMVGCDNKYYYIEADECFRLAISKPVGSSFRSLIANCVKDTRDKVLVLPRDNFRNFLQQINLIKTGADLKMPVIISYQAENDRIHCTCKSSSGTVEDIYAGGETTCNEKMLVVGYNPDYMAEMCSHIQSDSIGLQMSSSLKPTILEETVKEIRYLYGMAPVRVHQPEEESEKTIDAGSVVSVSVAAHLVTEFD